MHWLIIPYQESWKRDFEQIKEVLLASLNTLSIKIEHIGSTSVPGLAAKPIIDMDLVYEHLSDFSTILKSMEMLGYYHAGDQGIDGREVLKRNITSNHRVLDSISHHLYVCQKTNEELRRHLAFRDHLRANAETRLAYEKLKKDIAQEAGQNKKQYARLKEHTAKDFIEGVLKE